MDAISVAVISGPIPKDFSNPYYSFVFDEVYRLAKRGLNVHAIRGSTEKDSVSHGIHFHGLSGSFEIKKHGAVVNLD